jgi:hypothetical protein
MDEVDDEENANGNGSEWKVTEDDEGGWPRTVRITELLHNHGWFGLSVSSVINEHVTCYCRNDADVSMVR